MVPIEEVFSLVSFWGALRDIRWNFWDEHLVDVTQNLPLTFLRPAMIDPSDWELIYGDEIREYVERDGVPHIADFIRNKLETWHEVEVNLAITGDSGTGKSSFINAIRG